MDSYQESLKNVDTALARLNATLASYRVEEGSKNRPATPSARSGQSHDDDGRAVYLDPARSEGTTDNQSLVREHTQTVHGQAWEEVLSLRSSKGISPIDHQQIESALDTVQQIHALFRSGLDEYQYCLPLYILLAQKFLCLGYPDLAAGESYKALLLADAIQDGSDEVHDQAFEALHNLVLQHPVVERIQLLKNEIIDGLENSIHESQEADEGIDVEVGVWLRKHYLLLTYHYLIRSLFLCDCFGSAYEYIGQARGLYPNDCELQVLQSETRQAASQKLGFATVDDLGMDATYSSPLSWPNKGFVRREVYPWNEGEPDRSRELSALNEMMAKVSHKLEVCAVELPVLTGQKQENGTSAISVQLGVFAKEDVVPGEVVLNEKSMLTANNKLLDALCDACSSDLPDLTKGADTIVTCPECEVVFCSQECHDQAQSTYHRAQCGTDSEAIMKDVPPDQAADALYSLLLLRAMCMAETQLCHPLELSEVKYIWGDFSDLSRISEEGRLPDLSSVHSHLRDTTAAHAGLPRTLPFSFEYNVRLPFHMLQVLDVNIFSAPLEYNVWVFNTLYAKFRGTASARLSGLGGRAMRGPEVAAVHPMWCLANHSCDPNVSWEWGGNIKFWAREERVAWHGKDGKKAVKNTAGIRKGEEVLNHYCDIDLPVKERREWAKGALGGDCMCERCVWEAEQEAKS